MHTTPVANYTFSASGKTVTLTDVGTVRLDRLYGILNVTRGVVYYANTTGPIATVATNVITLNASVSTAGHADADKLTIVYDDGAAQALDGTDITGSSMPTGGAGIRGWLSAMFTSGIKLTDGSNIATISTIIADGVAAAFNRLRVVAALSAFNGTTMDAVRSGISAVTSSITGFLNTHSFLRYNASPPTLADGQFVGHQGDANGNLKVNCPTTLNVQFPSITTPATNYAITATAQTVAVAITPGGSYVISTQVPLLPTTNTLASATTAIGSPTITMASTTGAAVGQMVVGTGVPLGATIASFITNASITLTLPCTAAGTVSLTCTGGAFVLVVEAFNGTTWDAVNVIPKTLTTVQIPTSSITTWGMFHYSATATDQQLRVRCTTLTTIVQVNAFIENLETPGAQVMIPYAAGLTANVPPNMLFIPWIERSWLTQFVVDLGTFTGTTQTLAWQNTNDPLAANPQVLTHTTTTGTASSVAVSANTTGVYQITPSLRFFGARLNHTAITVMNVQGCNAVVGTPVAAVQPVHVLTLPTFAPGSSSSPAIPVNVVDAVSAAVTTSTTSSAITPAVGTSYTFDYNVTAVSGTSPTNDLVLQECTDGVPTNWFDRYHFPRITATGVYRTPILPSIGTRLRFVQTIAGTTPSFTRVINRHQSSVPAQNFFQYFDRTAGLLNGTLNATSSTYIIDGCSTINVRVLLGTATVAGTYQIRVSDDGTNWSSVGTATLAVASTNTTITATNIVARFAQVICTSAATTQTGTYVSLVARQ